MSDGHNLNLSLRGIDLYFQEKFYIFAQDSAKIHLLPWLLKQLKSLFEVNLLIRHVPEFCNRPQSRDQILCPVCLQISEGNIEKL